MHGRLHNFDDDEKGIVDKLAMSTQSCILDQECPLLHNVLFLSLLRGRSKIHSRFFALNLG